MATHDYVLDNATGANFRSDLNNALAAIVSNNSSSSEPSTKYAYQWWADTNDGVLKIRNSSNDGWVTLLQLDGTLTLEDGSASAPALGFRDDLDTGIFSSAANNLDIATGGSVRANISSTGLNVTGTVTDDGATHDGDVTFTGASANIVFDKSDNQLEFADNAKTAFGTGEDLKIYHDGSDSYLQNATGDLYIQTTGSGDDIFISAIDDVQINVGGETGAKFIDDGTVELYFDNSKKLETSSTGVTITGRLNMTEGIDIPDGGDNNTSLSIGSGNDLRLYHDGSDSYIKDRGTGQLSILSDVTNILNAAGNEYCARFKEDAEVELYYDGSVKFETKTSGVQVTGSEFISEGTIYLEKSGVHHHRILSNDTGNDLGFQQSSDTGANSNFTTYLRINDGGNISLPVDDQKLRIGAGADLQIYHGSGNNEIRSNGLVDIFIRPKDTDVGGAFRGDGAAELYHDGSKKIETTSSGINVTGAITVNGSALATGGGKVNQVVQSVKTGTTSTTDSNYNPGTDTGLNVSITPSASDSKVLILIHANFAGDGCRVNPVLKDGSTAFGFGVSNTGLMDYGLGNSDTDPFRFSFAYLVTPGDTSAHTYKLFFSKHGGSGTAYFNYASGSQQMSVSTMTAIEVLA